MGETPERSELRFLKGVELAGPLYWDDEHGRWYFPFPSDVIFSVGVVSTDSVESALEKGLVQEVVIEDQRAIQLSEVGRGRLAAHQDAVEAGETPEINWLGDLLDENED